MGGREPRSVVWTPHARDCLESILEYIASDSPPAAAKVLEVVLAAAESLAEFSDRGRVVPELRSSLIREIFVYRYRLIYRTSTDLVEVLAILHGAMDYERWMKEV
jgi:toxin ParE1/3/4